MRRTLATAGLLALALAVLGASVPAHAGGWDSLRFRRDHYLVGEVARARTEFFAGELEDSGPLDGRTYYAYLLPSSRDELFGMIDAPTVPPNAIRLGVLEVEGPLTKPDGYPYGLASLAFTVPDVPSGDYAIGFCDDPCTYETVGWLAWGFIRIVHTPLEGRLLLRLGRAESQADALQRQLRDAERRTSEVAERLGANLHATQMALRTSASGEDVSAPAEPRTVPSAPAGGSPWWIGAPVGAVLGAIAGAAATTVLSPRRTRRRDPGPPRPGAGDHRERVPEREPVGL
jgi:hypothetical protein